MTVNIAELYPYELCAITGKIAMQKELLEVNGTAPIKILKVDDQWLVLDGANRVMASKELGRTTIEAKELFRQPNEMPHYQDCLAKAIERGWKGYENFPKAEVPPEGGLRPKVPPTLPMKKLAPVQQPAPEREPKPPREASPRPVEPPKPRLGVAEVMNIVKGCTIRERYRLAAVVNGKQWVVMKAGKKLDLDASVAKLAELMIETTHDDLVFGLVEPAKK